MRGDCFSMLTGILLLSCALNTERAVLEISLQKENWPPATCWNLSHRHALARSSFRAAMINYLELESGDINGELLSAGEFYFVAVRTRNETMRSRPFF